MLSVIAICIGACVGALSRWQLGLWLNPGPASSALLPWGTLAANLIGGYLIGVCMGVFQQLPELDPVWRLALVTGFLGALTTFSSFSSEVVGMLQQGRFALATGTASLHLFGSLMLTLLGLKTVSLLWAH
jgi:CrcB protein